MTSFDNLEVRDPEVEEQMKKIGHMLREITPDGFGFIFLLASIGPGGSTFYTSSVEREGAIKLLREFLHRMELN